MSKLSKRLLGLSPETDSPEAHDGSSARSSSDESVNQEAAMAPIPMANAVGLTDAVRSGWFQNGTNELFRGIPIGPDDRVVDIGCGDGGNLLFCARRGAYVTAIDIDPQVIENIKPRLAEVAPQAHAAIVSDGNPLPLDDAVATRVICTEVLEHVDDPIPVLAELVRIGEPGSLYLIAVPDALEERLQQHVAPPSYFQKPNHLRIIEREQFAQMVTGAGLEIIEQTQYGFFWSIWWALFWACKVDLDEPNHPILDHWTHAWQAVLELPPENPLREQLNAFMPKSQIIVARKP